MNIRNVLQIKGPVISWLGAKQWLGKSAIASARCDCVHRSFTLYHECKRSRNGMFVYLAGLCFSDYFTLFYF